LIEGRVRQVEMLENHKGLVQVIRAPKLIYLPPRPPSGTANFMEQGVIELHFNVKVGNKALSGIYSLRILASFAVNMTGQSENS